MHDEQHALHWLWVEIARRFGPDQATELMLAFEEQRRAQLQNERLAETKRSLLELEARLRELQEAGEPETAYVLSLRWRIDHHRWLLQEAGPLYSYESSLERAAH